MSELRAEVEKLADAAKKEIKLCPDPSLRIFQEGRLQAFQVVLNKLITAPATGQAASEVDFGTPEEVIAGLDFINAHNAALAGPATPASARPAGPRCNVYTKLCKSQSDIEIRLECVRGMDHKEPHAYEFPMWPSNLSAPSIEPAQREALPAERTRKALENAIQCIMENIDCSGTEFSAEIDGVEEYHQVIWWVEQWQAALAAPSGKSEGLAGKPEVGAT